MKLGQYTITRQMKLIRLGLFAGSILLANASQANVNAYNIIGLEAPGGYRSHARAINDAGQVVGRGRSTEGYIHAIEWNGVTPTDLGTLGGTNSAAYAINNKGQIAGTSWYMYQNMIDRPTVWNGLSITDLNKNSNNILGGNLGLANAINNPGQVAGDSFVSDGHGTSYRHATLWNGTAATDLGTLGGKFSSATAINNAGQVAGWSDTVDGITHATRWNGTTPTILGTLGGAYSSASAINDSDQVVGWSRTSEGINQATLWNDTTAIALDTLGGTQSGANAINNLGQIVGYSYTTHGILPNATLWDNGTVINLNSFLDPTLVNMGWVLTQAYGINNKGWIVADAQNTRSNEFRAFLITPVPEPETYVMLLTGLGLMGFMSLRRKVSRPKTT